MREGIVEDVRDRLQRHPVLSRPDAIDVDVGREPFVLLDGDDVAEARVLAQLVHQRGTPTADFSRLATHQRVLVLAEAASGRDLNVLHGFRERDQSG